MFISDFGRTCIGRFFISETIGHVIKKSNKKAQGCASQSQCFTVQRKTLVECE